MNQTQHLRLLVGNHNYSSWSLRAWLCLSHFGLSFETDKVLLSQVDTSQNLAEKSPSKRVPVLFVDEQPVWDSLAICETVNDLFLQGKAWPEDPMLRATGRAICSEMHSSFMALRAALPMNIRKQFQSFPLSLEVQSDVQRVLAIWQDQLKEEREGGFLLGEFSIADCMYAPVVSRFTTYNIEVSEEVKHYMNRVLALPAMKAWTDLALAEEEIIAIEEYVGGQ